MTTPTCPYCHQPARPVESAVIYGQLRDYGKFWLCAPCPDAEGGKAYVGCHKGTTKPLGTLADANTRLWRGRAHRAFDPVGERLMDSGASKYNARNTAYHWLADHLGIDKKDCHMALFDVEVCQRVVLICRNETWPEL